MSGRRQGATSARLMSVLGWAAGIWLLWRLPRPQLALTAVEGKLPVGGNAKGELAVGGNAKGELAVGGNAKFGEAGAVNTPRSISLIVPARNEEASLPALLASLAVQTKRPDQVIVVDDDSADRTAAIAAASGALVLTSADLPAGWTGKTWACHQGALTATGALLIFLDADVTLAPTALACVVDEHRRHGGLISVQPFHHTEKPYESLSAMANVVALMGTGSFSGTRRQSATMAFGPCLTLSRDDYRRIGGHAHADVRGLVTEDIGLAHQMRAAGEPVSLFAGRDLLSFRMYPGGLAQLIEGWTKSLGAGGAGTRPLVAMACFAWVTGGLHTGGALALALVNREGRTRSAVRYAAWVAQIGWMLRRVGRFRWWTAPAYPLPLVAFVALFGRSSLLFAFRRQRTWRGRVVP